MSIGKSPLVAVALALAIFATGVGTGVAVDRLWLAPEKAERVGRRGGPSPARLLAKFEERMNLSAEQSAAIGKILEQVDAEMRAIHEQTGPLKAKVREATRARILEVLTPEQAVEYERIIAKEKRRRAKRKDKQHRRHKGDRNLHQSTGPETRKSP